MRKLIKIINRIVLVVGYITVLNLVLFFSGLSSDLFNKSDDAKAPNEVISALISDEGLRDDLNAFYQNAKNKNWANVYTLLDSRSKNNITKEVFLSMAGRHERSWELSEYKALSCEMYPQENFVRCVMYFNEDGRVHYGISQWTFENGRWRCVESGLTGIPVFYPLSEVRK